MSQQLNPPNGAPTSNNPATSTTGNSSSGDAGSGANTLQQPTAHNPSAGQQPVTFTPEQEAEVQRRADTAAAAARRAEQVAAETARQRAEQEARGDERGLRETAERERDEARRERDGVQRELWSLTAALDEGLTNPTVVAPRLRGNTLEELRADARQFKTLLGQAPPVHATPPATPAGGGAAPTAATPTGQQPTGDNNPPATTQQPTSTRVNVTDEQVRAEYDTGAYSGLL
jgi:hypothetical protein